MFATVPEVRRFVRRRLTPWKFSHPCHARWSDPLLLIRLIQVIQPSKELVQDHLPGIVGANPLTIGILRQRSPQAVQVRKNVQFSSMMKWFAAKKSGQPDPHYYLAFFS
ncbi:MAG: hypothetical protein WBX01_17770 [Nitrososphaeraceae archaeon]